MEQKTMVYLGDLQRFEVRPGDRFVLTLDHEVTADTLSRLKAYWKEQMGDETKLLILCKGMRLEVVSASKTGAQ